MHHRSRTAPSRIGINTGGVSRLKHRAGQEAGGREAVQLAKESTIKKFFQSEGPTWGAVARDTAETGHRLGSHLGSQSLRIVKPPSTAFARHGRPYYRPVRRRRANTVSREMIMAAAVGPRYRPRRPMQCQAPVRAVASGWSPHGARLRCRIALVPLLSATQECCFQRCESARLVNPQWPPGCPSDIAFSNDSLP